jgi:hypothetical protein
MGIESEQLVYDYLSRVGDLAQATALTAAERARLVSGLRETIDSRRPGTGTAATRTGSREAAAMKKVLDGIGRPDEVVRRAVHTGVPDAREAQGSARRRAEAGGSPSAPSAPSVPVQGRPPAAEGDWWRLGRGAADRSGRSGRGGQGESVYADGARGGYGDDFGGFGGGGGFGGAVPGSELGGPGELPGWTASYEPDFLHPDYVDPRSAKVPEQRLPEQVEPEPVLPAPPPRPGLLRRTFGRPVPARPAVEPAGTEPAAPAPLAPLPLVESLAVLVLASGAVLALWYVAVLGWFLAYSARRVGRGAAQFAGLWVPVLVAAVCGFWFYGHTHGRPPGQQLTDAQFKAGLRSTIAVWLRAAAACSALFLAWRITSWRRR